MRRGFLSLVIFFIVITISGCWDLKEVDRLAFGTTIGIDRESEDTIRVTVQIPQTQNLLPPGLRGGGGENKQFSLSSFTGISVNSAFAKLETKSSRDLVISQNKSIIIGTAAAQNDMRTILDFLVRNAQAPPQATVMIADGATAAEVLEMKLVTEVLPGLEFVQASQNIEKYDWTYFIPIWEFHQKLNHETKDAFASVIAMDRKEKRYVQAGLAVFSGDRLAGKLSPKEAQSFGILANLMRSGQMDFKLPSGEKVTLRNVDAKTRIKIKAESNLPHFLVRTKIKASFSELTGAGKEVSQADLQYLQKTIARMVQRDLQAVIKKLQGLNSDVIDFGEQLRVQHEGLWRKLDWRKTFPKVSYRVEVKVQILSDGVMR